MSSVAGNFIISVDTQKLVERLLNVKPGETVSYRELSDLIGRNVTDGARGQLRAARHKLQGEHRIDFEPVRGSGLRRIPDKEVALSGAKHIGHVRRAARRGGRRMSCVQQWDALPNEAKVKHNAAVAALGAIEHSANNRTLSAIQKHVENRAQLPTLAETLEHFKK